MKLNMRRVMVETELADGEELRVRVEKASQSDNPPAPVLEQETQEQPALGVAGTETAELAEIDETPADTDPEKENPQETEPVVEILPSEEEESAAAVSSEDPEQTPDDGTGDEPESDSIKEAKAKAEEDVALAEAEAEAQPEDAPTEPNPDAPNRPRKKRGPGKADE